MINAKEYKLICTWSHDELENTVNEWLNSGWELFGAVSIFITISGRAHYVQPMIK